MLQASRGHPKAAWLEPVLQGPAPRCHWNTARPAEVFPWQRRGVCSSISMASVTMAPTPSEKHGLKTEHTGKRGVTSLQSLLPQLLWHLKIAQWTFHFPVSTLEVAFKR